MIKIPLLDYFVKIADILDISKYNDIIQQISRDVTQYNGSETNKALINKYKFIVNDKEEEISVYIDFSKNAPKMYASFRNPIFDSDSECAIVFYKERLEEDSVNSLKDIKNLTIHEFTHAIDYFRSEKNPLYENEDFTKYSQFYYDMGQYLLSLNRKDRNESFVLKDESFKSIFKKHNYIIDDNFKKRLHTFVYYANAAEDRLNNETYYNSSKELLAYTNEIIGELQDAIDERDFKIIDERSLIASVKYFTIKDKMSRKNWQIMVDDILRYFKVKAKKEDIFTKLYKQYFDIRP